MPFNIDFYKICLIQEFLSNSTSLKRDLLDTLIINGTDPIIRMRRMRMLTQLSEYESQILKKIQNFTTDDPNDLNSFLISEMYHIADRSA